MRRSRASQFVIGLAMAVLVVGSIPATAQEREEFPGPDAESPLTGYTRNDGTVVLSDESFCRFILGSLFGDERLTYVGLIDRSKKQKKAKGAAFVAGADEETVARCVDAIGAYRSDPPEGDPLVAWSRRAPVVPEALAGLLTEDFEARPLAQPDEIGPAARTTGYGDETSAPFEMAASTWLAEVDNTSCDIWTGVLRNARDSEDVIELSTSREYLYDVSPGHYYWDVLASGCDWSVDLVPIELGPDPNTTPSPRVPVPALHGPEWNPVHKHPNPEFLTAPLAREALLGAGFTVGECTEGPQGKVSAGRVWAQEPVAGTLAEVGTAIDAWMTSDCDVLRGERVILE